MNFGSSIKKLATEFHLTWRTHRHLDLLKFNIYPGTNGISKNSNKDQKTVTSDQSGPNLFILPKQKLFYVVPRTDLGHLRSIVEPEERRKVNLELPLRNLTDKVLDLPCNIEREIIEPNERIIIKKAERMVRIRKRKMRLHKRKKYRKKRRFELVKLKQQKEMLKEMKFQAGLKDILKEIETFDPNQYVDDSIAKINWERPITRVRGRLAPQWVIQDYLQKKEEKKILEERLNECKKFMR